MIRWMYTVGDGHIAKTIGQNGMSHETACGMFELGALTLHPVLLSDSHRANPHICGLCIDACKRHVDLRFPGKGL